MSDEIPVGSPPVPRGRHAAPGGWYPDPANTGQERYWDGWQWTRNVRPAPGHPGPVQSGVHPGPVPAVPYPYPTQGQFRPAKPVAVTADGIPLAGWWWRVLAYVIDSILVSIVVGIIGAVTGLTEATNRSVNAYEAYLTEVFTTGTPFDVNYALTILTPPERHILTLVTIGCFVVYVGIMLHARGATLGKMACGLRVVPVGQGRSTPGLPWSTAFLRPLLGQVMEQLFIPGLINVLFPLWDDKRQTLHDKVVKTQVVREVRTPRALR